MGIKEMFSNLTKNGFDKTLSKELRGLLFQEYLECDKDVMFDDFIRERLQKDFPDTYEECLEKMKGHFRKNAEKIELNSVLDKSSYLVSQNRDGGYDYLPSEFPFTLPISGVTVFKDENGHLYYIETMEYPVAEAALLKMGYQFVRQEYNKLIYFKK
jgi:hypothetical protein